MKLHYYPNTDSLSIDLSSNASEDSREISEGVVTDVDEQGHVVGLDIQNASSLLDLPEIRTECLPLPLSA